MPNWRTFPEIFEKLGLKTGCEQLETRGRKSHDGGVHPAKFDSHGLRARERCRRSHRISQARRRGRGSEVSPHGKQRRRLRGRFGASPVPISALMRKKHRSISLFHFSPHFLSSAQCLPHHGKPDDPRSARKATAIQRSAAIHDR